MNILDKRFKYVPAIKTDIRATFSRVDPQDDWKSRVEGAKRVLTRIQTHTEPKRTPLYLLRWK